MLLPWLLLSLSIITDASPPNIVFILADDYGYNDIGYHNPDILTPNMDTLASEGVILEQSYVQPVCSPTRFVITKKSPNLIRLYSDRLF